MTASPVLAISMYPGLKKVDMWMIFNQRGKKFILGHGNEIEEELRPAKEEEIGFLHFKIKIAFHFHFLYPG